MKYKKKKKRELRKLRKQRKRSPPQPFDKWLTPELNKKLWNMARIMTKLPPKYKKELHNKKFWCDTCKKAYCITINGDGIAYCKDCHYGKGCIKEIKTIRDCELCEGE